MKFKLRRTYIGIMFVLFSTFSLIWFILHPEELARPFEAKLVGVLSFIFSVILAYGCYLNDMHSSGEKTT